MSAPVVNGRKMAWQPDRLPPGGVPEAMQAAHLLRADPVPARSSNLDLRPVAPNQGGLGSCVGNGTEEGARGEMIRAGAVNPAMGSRLWIYYLARAFDHDTANDDGTQIHNAFAAIAKWGLPPEALWPYSDDSSPGAPFSRMPSPEAWQAAMDATIAFKMHRITSSGHDRVDDIKRALGQRRLVVFGTQVSEDYCGGNFDPTVPLPPPIGLTIAGGHCQVVIDHDGDTFRIGNSWGPDWQDAGCARFSADYMAWDETNDLWVFDSAPKTLGGAL